MTSSSEKNHKSMVSLLGPAFVAATAYADPGNMAASLPAGASCGYLLLWVLVMSSLVAVAVQYLLARYGLVTGRSLTESVADRFSSNRPGRLVYWIQVEIAAATTDVAEIIGGTTALYLLFRTPILLGGVIVDVVSLGLLLLQGERSQRTFEGVIVAFLLVITVGFLAGLFATGLSLGEMANGVPSRFQGVHTMVLAASILGATVMPHAAYLHSGLVRGREYKAEDDASLRRHLRTTRIDVFGALVLAGSVNVSILCLAAETLPRVEETDSIEGTHATVTSALGPMVGMLFGVGLLASRLASSSASCYAGDLITCGLSKVHVPMLIRRIVTIIPALLIIINGAEPTWALVLSQVVLSIGILFALVPLVYMTSSRAGMGIWANIPLLHRVAWVICGLIITPDVALTVLVLMEKG